MSTDTRAVRAGYRWCLRLARTHYENFPVASLLLPTHVREAVVAIYAFARSADDIADEGALSDTQRLRQLADMDEALHAIASGQILDIPLYQALADSVSRYRLPLQPFHDLLSAFRQDVDTKRYATFDELLDYCRRSANPVGRLLLHLAGAASLENLLLSDNICSALQLINFLQDIAQDYRENGRIYMPLEDMARFGVTEADIAGRRNSPALHALVQHQAGCAHRLLRSGSALGDRLPGRFGVEIRITILAAFSLLDKLYHQEDVFSRPRLARTEKAAIFWHALRRVSFERRSPLESTCL
jgi:squalene synthase HpnC